MRRGPGLKPHRPRQAPHAVDREGRRGLRGRRRLRLGRGQRRLRRRRLRRPRGGPARRGPHAGADGAGAVTILYGSAKGLTGHRSRQVPSRPGRSRTPGSGRRWPSGDLDGDGYPDLAVGCTWRPGQRPVTEDNPASGTVTVTVRQQDGAADQGEHGVCTACAGPTTRTTGSARRSASPTWTPTAGPTSSSGPGPPGRRRRRRVRRLGCRTARARLEGPTAVPAARPQRRPAGLGRGGHRRTWRATPAPRSSSACLRAPSSTDPGTWRCVTPVRDRRRDHGPGDLRATERDLGVPGCRPRRRAGRRLRCLAGGGPAWTATATTTSSSGRRTSGVGDERAGRVVLVHGGAGGLATEREHRVRPGHPGRPGRFRERGRASAPRSTLLDRDGDGRADLTIGSPGEDDDGGRVTTLLAAGSGFTTAGAGRTGCPRSHDDDGYDDGAGASFGAVLGR